MPLPPLVSPVAELSATERERTARHASLVGFGEVGQRHLAAAHVAVMGAGGLGAPIVLALTAAGVGRITVIDDDVVELSNLQRQVIHRRDDIGKLKVDSVTRVAADLSDTVVVPVTEHLTADNAARLLDGADLVIDGSDRFTTRASIAVGAEALGIPLVWGTIQEFSAQVTVFWNRPPAGAEPVVLADLYPPDSVGQLPSCADVGVLGALCLQVGSLMALEAIKLIAGIGEPLLGRILFIDALKPRQTEVPLRAATAVTAGISGDTPQPEADTRRVAKDPRGYVDENDAPPAPGRIADVTAEQMLQAQDAGATLLDVREPWETETGIVAGSVVIPLGDLLTDPDQVDADEVVVICAHGVRAHRAAAVLAARGVSASVLAGGLAAWTNGSA